MCQSLDHVLTITVGLPLLEDLPHNIKPVEISAGIVAVINMTVDHIALIPLRSARYVILFRDSWKYTDPEYARYDLEGFCKDMCIYQCQDTIFDKNDNMH